MPVEEETVLVGDEADDPVEAVVGELGHRSAPGTDEMSVLGVPGRGFEPPDPLAEVMGARQPRLDQDIEGAVDRRGADPVPPVAEAALQRLGRQVAFSAEEGVGDEVALPGDGESVVAKPATELLEELGRLFLTEAHSTSRKRRYRR